MQNGAPSKNSKSFERFGRIRSILARLKREPSPAFHPMIEGLESRALFSSGPALAGVEILGQVGAVTGIVLTFDEPLSPTTAQSTQAYAFGKPPPPPSSSSSGFSIGDLFAFRYSDHAKSAVKKIQLVKSGKIQMASAVYDATANTVTLRPYAPFKATAYFKFLRIKGTGPNAIDDMQGNPLNGGKDTAARWTLHQGRTVNYHDANGDHVTLKLTGPGKLYVFARNSKDTQPVIFVQGATAATTLDGALKNNGAILPVVNIAEIQGALGITNHLLNNPEFNVGVTT